MKIGSLLFTPNSAKTDPDVTDENTANKKTHTNQRQRRAIDTSPPKNQELVQERVQAPNLSEGIYDDVNINPTPGKTAGVNQKTPIPVNLGININVDPAIKSIADSFKSIDQEASIFLKEKFAEMAAKAKTPAEKEKWDIDPDNTYLVTFDYNTTGERPYSAKVIKSLSLTEALITNAQDAPVGEGKQVAYYPGGPEVVVRPEFKAHSPSWYQLSSRFNIYSEKADTTHTYQGIYFEPSESNYAVFNGANQSSISPAEFKSLIWKADFQQPYNDFLDTFWNSHAEKYTTMAKASFVKSALSQHQEGSLTSAGRELVMRAAGLPGNQGSWPDITYEDLKKNPPKDSTVEVGLLKLGQYESTDLVYMTDLKVTFDASGRKVPPLTLLYIPGNSSPIHSFNSQAEMKTWLAKQMADPVKREAMAGHFPLKDKPNGFARAGLTETLIGFGVWPEYREIPGGALGTTFSYDSRAFSGRWDPQELITTQPNNSPFDEVTTRQKKRAYADAAVNITSDSDVTKKHILSGLENATKAALFLTPLALVIPEVGLALDAFYLLNAATETGIGIDNVRQGKPDGTGQIVFGVFNAALVLVPHLKKGLKSTEGSLIEKKAPENFSTLSEYNVNRLRPSKWGDISELAVKNGDELIAGVQPNAKGIYQVKGPDNEVRWFIKVTDQNNIPRVLEIDRRFKPSNGYAYVIDSSQKIAMTIHSTRNGEWEPILGMGGVKWPWKTESSVASQFDPGAYDYPAEDVPSSSKTTTKIDKQLKNDADLYHKTAKTKVRPTLSDIPKNASTTEAINSVYKKSTGMILGEDHTEIAGLRILIDDADTFESNGVKILYSEGFEHSIQPDLDRFFETGEFSPALRKNLKLIDRAHAGHEPYTNRNLLLKMREKGIRIKAIDVPSAANKERRLKNMNFYAANVIEKDQALNPQEKWVARVGSEHVFKYDSNPPIQGLSELTGATGVSVDNAVANAGTTMTQSLDKTELYIDLGPR